MLGAELPSPPSKNLTRSACLKEVPPTINTGRSSLCQLKT
jgi:hypothetical protein